MQRTPFHKLYRQNKLWPTVHSAIDVYERRRMGTADPYELMWRMIHIWECTAITLAGGALARIREFDRQEPETWGPHWLGLREKLYGITRPEPGDAPKQDSKGALNGSLDRWIEILGTIANLTEAVPHDSKFMRKLCEFLNEGRLDSEPFIRVWRRACDVPDGEARATKDVMKRVNQFRNRFAHVPFPHYVVGDMCQELERLTNELFRVGFDSAVCGSFIQDRIAVSGGVVEEREDTFTSDSCFFFTGDEHWPSGPFFRLDGMHSPSLLTRLKNDAGSWEFTRYQAEANAVQTVLDPDAFLFLPIPEREEYLEDDLPEHSDPVALDSDSKVHSYNDALNFLKERNFEPAIKFLSEYTKENPNYHVGWLKLGLARREFAVDRQAAGAENEELIALLEQAIADFNRAGAHVDLYYKADASYNMSKAYWRAYQWTGSEDFLDQALGKAREALGYDPEERYESWIEYIERSFDRLA